VNTPHKPGAPIPLDHELSMTVGKICKWAMPDLQSVTVVLVRPSGMSVQGAGEIKPRELARAMRQFADALERESSAQAGLIIPVGRA
jgi:hypothetical protein